MTAGASRMRTQPYFPAEAETYSGAVGEDLRRAAILCSAHIHVGQSPIEQTLPLSTASDGEPRPILFGAEPTVMDKEDADAYDGWWESHGTRPYCRPAELLLLDLT